MLPGGCVNLGPNYNPALPSLEKAGYPRDVVDPTRFAAIPFLLSYILSCSFRTV